MTPEQERKLDRVLEGQAETRVHVSELKEACQGHFERDEEWFSELRKERREFADRIVRVEERQIAMRRWISGLGGTGGLLAVLEGLRQFFSAAPK